MFSNISGKLKTLAKVLCWVGIIFSVISGAVILSGGNSISSITVSGTSFAVSPVAAGIIIIVIGCLTSWISSLFIYGFGQLIENTEKSR